MSRSARKATKAVRKKQRLLDRHQQYEQEQQAQLATAYAPRIIKTPLEGKSEDQVHYILAIEEAELTFGLGPAGTGKTYVAAALAAEALEKKKTQQIILTRPAVSAKGEDMGFEPGTVEEKFEPWLGPYRDALDERLGKSTVDYLLKVGRIKAVPFKHMRGRTFKDAWIILDEAQNTSPETMKMFLTRIGTNCKVIVNGDIRQSDLVDDYGNKLANGLEDALNTVGGLRRVKVIELKKVVRSGLVQDIIEAYEGK